jgi:Fe2+ transport system protein FeoA
MSLRRLSDLAPLDRGILEHVEDTEAVLPLIEMGVCPGEFIVVAHVAPGRGPIAIEAAGRTIAMRRDAADHLWVRVEGRFAPKSGMRDEAPLRGGEQCEG